MGEVAAVAAAGAPAPALASLVQRYRGSRFEGFAPGVHRGLPTRNLEFIICLGSPLTIGSGDASEGRTYTGLVAGLHHRPVEVAHDGSMRNVSLELTPQGARRLLGVPAADLAGRVVALDAVLGQVAAELTERLAAAAGWDACCAVLDQVLGTLAARTSDSRASADDRAQRTWRRIVDTTGTIQIADLATESGYSRRYLRAKFMREYGISPKQAARIVRFERSCELVRSLDRFRRITSTAAAPTLAEIATLCGYYDQAHMTRDWNDLAGSPPARWIDSEELPFVQDNDRDFGGGS